ncbi:hypothetical protein KC19_3G075300 [Ceratodon purpureus]|uniref:Protein kinase domain-containing protein n=1 Tax=Ceratodon purpureus TaxID=3225 RepID=A0A8T0IH45_CERPU|nr:hypothetical protein KC19_3G075300 [Ceratodon purpureus]
MSRSQCVTFVLLAVLCCVEAQNTSFSFPSFLADDGSITQVEDVSFNGSLESYDVNYNAFVTGNQEQRCGRVLYKDRVRMVDKKLARAASFNTSFTFSFLQTNPKFNICGSGMVFTFTGSSDFTATQKSRRGKGMCTFNPDDKDASNRVFAVKFDSSLSPEFSDPSDGSVGIVLSNKGNTNLSNYNLCGGNKTNCRYFCGDKGNFTAWIDYDGAGDTLEVRFRNGSLKTVPKPASPVLRVTNLSLHEVFDEEMYVGFTASTFQEELHRIRSWNFNSSGLPKPADLKPWKIGAILGVSAAVLAVILLAGALCFLVFKYRPLYFGKLEQHAIDLTDAPRAFTYKELAKITKGFNASERLSSGAFGDVYKGTLPSGAMVAVKRIKGNREQGEESFLAEATSLRQIRHRNLLQLRGWCHSQEGLLLVYDYMCNGSLNKWLHPNPRQPNLERLPWNVRRSILAGVASGLAYLHEEWVQCILHRDIKSSNVLLDQGFNPYLGDFGLARLVDHQKLQRTTLLAGTLGYMAPEMQYTGRATKESDVYAFGILVLEVVCERRPLATQAVEPGDYVLLDRVWRAHEAGNISKVADTSLSTSERETLAYPSFEEKMMIAKFLQVGLLCCLPNPSQRPSMRVVSQWLRELGVIELPRLPNIKPYSQYSGGFSSQGTSSSKSSDFSRV